MSKLQGKVAIITGASSGIGYATAKLFANEKAKLIVAARRKEKLADLVVEIERQGGEAVAIAGDVKEEAYHQELVTAALKHFGALDIAYNNAGMIGQPSSVPDMSLENWQNTLNTNLTSAFFAAKYQLPAMQQNGAGSIIFTSTFVGYSVGFPSMAAYAASKSGLIGLTQTLAAEYGSQGIRVNALLPGATDTPMGRAFANTPEIMEFVTNLYALKRIAQPEEIAQAALYLASDMSSFTTGTAMLADGGVSINRT